MSQVSHIISASVAMVVEVIVRSLWGHVEVTVRTHWGHPYSSLRSLSKLKSSNSVIFCQLITSIEVVEVTVRSLWGRWGHCEVTLRSWVSLRSWRWPNFSLRSKVSKGPSLSEWRNPNRTLWQGNSTWCPTIRQTFKPYELSLTAKNKIETI